MKWTRHDTVESVVVSKYLTFLLGQETYGFEIQKVQEIIRLERITPVPRTPAFIRGVINLRGRMIPIVDMRLQFAMAEIPYTEKTCIVIVRVWRGEAEVTMGVIVDEVAEVLAIKEEQLSPPPPFGATINTDFILGLAQVNQRVITLLDIDLILSYDDLAAVDGTLSESPQA